MGITGLLPFVKNSCRPAHIKDFSGATVAIDAYSWLHKGAFACAEKLVKGEKTDGYVFYCIKLINMLLDAGVKPIMVFDGCNLSSKAVTEKKRRENRDKTRQRGKELLCEGKLKEARECFQRCVDVTPEMAREVIQVCRKKSIDCIVAPYEADAQLAYLDKIGMAQLIITEDSDLILFGCSKILFKMDSCGGGLLFEKENLPKSFGANASKFSFEKFRYMCILSGCDYLPSLPGIGLAKACKFFTLTSITDLSIVLSKLPSYLKMPKLVVSNEYKESFLKANNTFLYQLAFCPKKKSLVPLNPYPEEINPEDMEYAGKYLSDDIAYELAMGNINVKTLKEFDVRDFDTLSFQSDKSVVWGSASNLQQTNALDKRESTAFKFNTPKRKIETTLKRKYVEQDCESGSSYSTEDLFSMYGGSDLKKSKLSDCYEEEPIVQSSESTDELNSSLPTTPLFKSSPKLSNLPLKKIVRSRFFSSESVPNSINSSPNNSCSPSLTESQNEDFLSSSCVSDTSTVVSALNEEEDVAFQEDVPKWDNKENIVNRFAKKKPADRNSKSSIVEDKTFLATSKQETVSLLDVFSNESSATTSTLSSEQKSAKILSETAKVDGSTKIGQRSLFSKNNSSRKLITTKIHDFKWSKEPVCKGIANISLGSDGNSCDESFEIPPDVDPIAKSPLKEISPFFLNCSDSSAHPEALETLITILSDCEEINDSETNSPKSPKKSLSKTSGRSNSKLDKCRSIGLPKKRKSSEKLSRKETLLNFNFTRKPLSMKTG